MSTSIELRPGAAVMAHKIIYEDTAHTLAIARHEPEGVLSISPFDTETHTTEFINGTIVIASTPQGGFAFTPLKPSGKGAQR